MQVEKNYKENFREVTYQVVEFVIKLLPWLKSMVLEQGYLILFSGNEQGGQSQVHACTGTWYMIVVVIDTLVGKDSDVINGLG